MGLVEMKKITKVFTLKIIIISVSTVNTNCQVGIILVFPFPTYFKDFILPDQDVNCTLLNQTRCPISMDIAKHIESRGHTNFVPISGGCTVKIRNLSFSADHHKIVVKKWKRLIRDGDITEVNYDIPRTCGKCKAVIPDAIEMFKHIRQRHHHQHD